MLKNLFKVIPSSNLQNKAGDNFDVDFDSSNNINQFIKSIMDFNDNFDIKNQKKKEDVANRIGISM
jgi:hypothetical protein